MAKKSNSGSAPKGQENAVKGAENRKKKSVAAKTADARRDSLREDGSFYAIKNGDRFTDIFALEAGTPGEYAFPGGDQPSAHFVVFNNGTPDEPFMVVRFQGAHKDHPLPGNLNTEVFLPINKLSYQRFDSRLTGDWASTQNAMFDYLTEVIDSTPAARSAVPVAKAPSTSEELMRIGNPDIRTIFAAKPGDLLSVSLMKRGGGKGVVLLEAGEVHGHIVVRVKESTFEPIKASKNWYLPVHCLDYDVLTQVTCNATYQQQCELHMALRWALRQFGETSPAVKRESESKQVVADPTPPEPVATSAAKQMPTTTPLPKKEPGAIDFQLAVRLDGPKIGMKLKEGKPPILVYVGEGKQRVFLMRERVAGVQKIRLIKADDHPTLSAIIETHPQGVDVEIKNVVLWKEPAFEIGNLGEMKNARAHLEKWLHDQLPSIGFRLKNQEEPKSS